MTVGEIYSVIWAATRTEEKSEDDMSYLYDKLMDARACYNNDKHNQESEA